MSVHTEATDKHESHINLIFYCCVSGFLMSSLQFLFNALFSRRPG